MSLYWEYHTSLVSSRNLSDMMWFYYASLNRRVHRLVLEFRDNPEITKYMDKLERARPDMFRFVLNPRIPSENNPAERALREIVVYRKIRGALRSLDGVVILGNILTCVTTWSETKSD